MKKLVVLLLAVLSLGLLPACVNAADTALLGQAFSLKTGQTVRLASEDMRITFQEVSEDSRCPSGVQCIWAGQATSVVKIVYGDDAYIVPLTEIGSGQDTPHDFLIYKIAFELQPYPVYGTTLRQADYRLKLTVTK